MLPSFLRVAVVALVALASACLSFDFDEPGLDGSGTVVSQTRVATGFDEISVEDEFDVVVTIGPEHSVQVTGDDNLLPHVRTELRGRTLHVETRRELDPTDEIRVTITAPSLVSLASSGSSDVRASGIRSSAFEASVSGSSDMVAQGDFGDLDTSVSGSGSIRLEGTADRIEAGVSGSGDLDLAQVVARSASVHVSGSGSAAVHVVEALDASVSGSGDVRYMGQPRVQSSVSGSGSVRQARSNS
jgi:hypothetical protein